MCLCITTVQSGKSTERLSSSEHILHRSLFSGAVRNPAQTREKKRPCRREEVHRQEVWSPGVRKQTNNIQQHHNDFYQSNTNRSDKEALKPPFFWLLVLSVGQCHVDMMTRPQSNWLHGHSETTSQETQSNWSEATELLGHNLTPFYYNDSESCSQWSHMSETVMVWELLLLNRGTKMWSWKQSFSWLTFSWARFRDFWTRLARNPAPAWRFGPILFSAMTRVLSISADQQLPHLRLPACLSACLLGFLSDPPGCWLRYEAMEVEQHTHTHTLGGSSEREVCRHIFLSSSHNLLTANWQVVFVRETLLIALQKHGTPRLDWPAHCDVTSPPQPADTIKFTGLSHGRRMENRF